MYGGAALAHVVEVVVLSPGSYNLLTCCRPVIGACFTAKEHFLELIHSRVDEQQCGILGRNQGGTSYDGVTTIFEVLEKTPANFITVHEVVPIPLVYRPREILDGLEGEKDGTRPVFRSGGRKCRTSILALRTSRSEGQSQEATASSMIARSTPASSKSFSNPIG